MKKIKETKIQRTNITFEAAAAACCTSSIDRQVQPTSRPCTLLACLPSPSCFRQPRFSLRLLPPPSPFTWSPPITDAWRFLLNFVSSSCHLTMNRLEASRTPRNGLPAFFAAMGLSAVSTPNINGECSVDPAVARNTLK